MREDNASRLDGRSERREVSAAIGASTGLQAERRAVHYIVVTGFHQIRWQSVL
jgi:hypothetical protein